MLEEQEKKLAAEREKDKEEMRKKALEWAEQKAQEQAQKDRQENLKDTVGQWPDDDGHRVGDPAGIGHHRRVRDRLVWQGCTGTDLAAYPHALDHRDHYRQAADHPRDPTNGGTVDGQV